MDALTAIRVLREEAADIPCLALGVARAVLSDQDPVPHVLGLASALHWSACVWGRLDPPALEAAVIAALDAAGPLAADTTAAAHFCRVAGALMELHVAAEGVDRPQRALEALTVCVAWLESLEFPWDVQA